MELKDLIYKEGMWSTTRKVVLFVIVPDMLAIIS